MRRGETCNKPQQTKILAKCSFAVVRTLINQVQRAILTWLLIARPRDGQRRGRNNKKRVSIMTNLCSLCSLRCLIGLVMRLWHGMQMTQFCGQDVGPTATRAKSLSFYVFPQMFGHGQKKRRSRNDKSSGKRGTFLLIQHIMRSCR